MWTASVIPLLIAAATDPDHLLLVNGTEACTERLKKLPVSSCPIGSQYRLVLYDASLTSPSEIAAESCAGRVVYQHPGADHAEVSNFPNGRQTLPTASSALETWFTSPDSGASDDWTAMISPLLSVQGRSTTELGQQAPTSLYKEPATQPNTFQGWAFGTEPPTGKTTDFSTRLAAAHKLFEARFGNHRNTRKPNIRVAVIDSGIRKDFAESYGIQLLDPKVIDKLGVEGPRDGRFVRPSAPTEPHNPHGETVTALLASSRHSKVRFAGAWPRAEVAMITAFDGEGRVNIYNLACAITYAVNIKSDIIVISAEIPTTSADCTPAPEHQMAALSIGYASEGDIPVVTSAGNTDAGCSPFPANYARIYPNVIAVGGHASDGMPAYPTTGRTVSILAPGSAVSIPRSDVSGEAGRRANFNEVHGSSIAVPFVAGTIAMILDAARQAGLPHRMTARQMLFWSGRWRGGSFNSRAGYLDAEAALLFALDPSPPTWRRGTLRGSIECAAGGQLIVSTNGSCGRLYLKASAASATLPVSTFVPNILAKSSMDRASDTSTINILRGTFRDIWVGPFPNNIRRINFPNSTHAVFSEYAIEEEDSSHPFPRSNYRQTPTQTPEATTTIRRLLADYNALPPECTEVEVSCQSPAKTQQP